MIALRVLASRVRGLLAGRRRDAELDTDIQAHLELLTDEHVRAGMSPADARDAARRAFGGVPQIKERYRDQGGFPAYERFAADVRVALRSSITRPGFAGVVVTTLALGIGATVAMFAVLDQVVLRPLPYPDADRLVRLQSPVPGVRADAVWNLSTAEYFYFRQHARTLEDIGIYFSTTGTLTTGTGMSESTAERVLVGLVSSEVFHLLGIRPVLGRLFAEGDGRYDQRTEFPPAVILSYDVWQRRFNGASDVISRTVAFEGAAFPIVGVLGPGAELPETAFVPTTNIGIWMPLGLNPDAPAVNQHTFRAIAKLGPAVSLTAARAELDTLTARLPEQFPGAYSPAFMGSSRFSTEAVLLRDDLLGSARQIIWLLTGAIGLVFLITAANVANLFVARAAHRRRELTVRLAIGASTLHLIRHTLAESLLYCLIAAILGVGLASAALQLLVALAPAGVPRLGDVHIDWISVGVALAASVVAAIGFAILASVRTGLDDQTLRQQRPSASRAQRRMMHVLVAAQVALALVLGTGAVLMVRSVRHLLQVDPGFDAAGVLGFDLVLPRTRYTSEQRVADYHRELTARLEADPEIDYVGAATTTPLDGMDGCTAVLVEDQSASGARQGACVDTPRVTAGYFEALRIAIRGDSPRWNGTPGVVVSDSLAKRLWPGEDPIGKGIRLHVGRPPYYRVVGVASDLHRNGLDRPPVESAYFPVVSLEGSPLFGPPLGMRVVLRTSRLNPTDLMPRVRAIVTAIDSNVPIADVQTMDDLVAQSMAPSSFTTSLLTMAAFLAVVLSGIGLYGVVSYSVASRRGEFGVRLAIGARPSGLRGIVVRETLLLVTGGLLVGTIAALGLTRFLTGFLFAVSPHDPATLTGVSLFLLCVGLLAAAIPAWRASETDPLDALRCH